MSRNLTLLLLFFFSGLQIASAGEKRISRSEYIDQWKDEAIYQMVMHKIPASVTLAQGILESGDGNSTLARKANNHFGIKCHSTWKGKRTYHDDDKKGECFRKYEDARESFEDHSQFLKSKRYSSLYSLKITDYKGWCKGLKKAGYATNNKYASLLIRIIEENNLDQYDKLGVKRIKSGDTEDLIAERSKEQKKKKTKAVEDKKGGNESIKIHLGREVLISKNDIKYVLAKEGDTPTKIAEDLDLMPWQIKKYNDLENLKGQLSEGDVIYLQPKRSKAKKDYHIVKSGESLKDISQQYGVKIKSLCKRNGLQSNSPLKSGQKIYLRGRAK